MLKKFRLFEGPGGGISLEVEIGINYLCTITKDSSSFKEKNINIGDLKAESYDNGMEGVHGNSMLDIEDADFITAIKDLKISKENFNGDDLFNFYKTIDETVEDSERFGMSAVENSDDVHELLKGLTIGDLLEDNPDSSIEVDVEIDGEYKDSSSILSIIKIGDTIFDGDGNLEVSTLTFNGIDYNISYTYNDTQIYDDFCDSSVPSLKAKQKYVWFHEEIFRNFHEGVRDDARYRKDYVIVDGNEIVDGFDDEEEAKQNLENYDDARVVNVYEISSEELDKLDIEPTTDDYYFYRDYLEERYKNDGD